MTIHQAVLPTILGYLLLAMVVPTLRVYRRTGVFPVVFHREADPVQALFGGVMKVFFGALVGWGVALELAPPATLSVWAGPAWLSAVGGGLVVAGGILTLAAQRAMGASWRVGIDDRPTALVTGGPFRAVRNPIFTGMLATLGGLVLVAPSPWSVAGFVFAVTLIALQVRLEEQHLARLHGDTYAAYAAKVGRFLPGLGRLRAWSGGEPAPGRAAESERRSASAGAAR